MDLKEYLDDKKITRYYLSKVSGIPKTTINDICSGKTVLHNCSAKTVQKLSEALGCTMEFIMSLDANNTRKYDKKTGLPYDKKYLECGLPEYLKNSLKKMICSWKILDRGETDLRWDLYWCELNADINSAEVEQEISQEQAWYLREKYLRMKREDIDYD